MTIDWQDLAAITIVVAAIAYLIRRGWLVLRSRAVEGCGACPTCASPSEMTPTVVTTESLALSAHVTGRETGG